MDFDEVIKKRKMIREYQHDRQIPTDIINKLLRNAHRSPSAGHTQVQEFIVVIDPITKRKLCQASLGQSQVEDASVLIIVCSNTSRSVDRYRKRGIEFYSIIDGAFASMIILLSAVNEGIGASFVGAFLELCVLSLKIQSKMVSDYRSIRNIVMSILKFDHRTRHDTLFGNYHSLTYRFDYRV
jgi:nitroreductase